MRFQEILTTLAFVGGALAAPGPLEARQARTFTVNTGRTYQEIDGLGFSAAFQRANLIVNMTAPRQKEILDLLFNTTTGAGFSILRNGIGSSVDSRSDWMNTFHPNNPGSPTATPRYVWDGKDSGQLWLSQKAVEYGVTTFYGNAWSAPGFMKNNNNDANGGSLCGLQGVNCGNRGDWRQAYADYLVQYIRFYAEAGVKVTHLGWLNEPDYTASYASMTSSGQQAAEFLRILHPTLQRANMSDVQIACCDTMGWQNGQNYANAINSAGAINLLSVVTSHTYSSNFNGPINTSRKVWQSEYCDLQGQWSTAWYSNGGAGDGYTWANTLHRAFTIANMNAYLWWEGVQWPNPNTNEKLIRIDGNNYTVSKRFWAFAQYSRYVRPGARRVDVSGSGVNVTAYLNRDGSLVIVALNTGTGSSALTFNLGTFRASSAESYLTDNNNDMRAQPTNLNAEGSSVTATVTGRGLITFKLTPRV